MVVARCIWVKVPYTLTSASVLAVRSAPVRGCSVGYVGALNHGKVSWPGQSNLCVCLLL